MNLKYYNERVPKYTYVTKLFSNMFIVCERDSVAELQMLLYPDKKLF